MEYKRVFLTPTKKIKPIIIQNFKNNSRFKKKPSQKTLKCILFFREIQVFLKKLMIF